MPLDAALFFILLTLYVVLGGYMEHIHAKFGHETGIALIMGLIISAILHFATPNPEKYDIPFDGTVFFYVCLPPIIFASGFNMRRRRFFANIGYILMFGVFGTIVTFMAFSLLTYGAVETGLMYKWVKTSPTG